MLQVWRALTVQYLAIRPNLELKAWPKQLLGYLPSDIPLDSWSLVANSCFDSRQMSVGQMVLTKSHGAKKQQENQIYLKVFFCKNYLIYFCFNVCQTDAATLSTLSEIGGAYILNILSEAIFQ